MLTDQAGDTGYHFCMQSMAYNVLYICMQNQNHIMAMLFLTLPPQDGSKSAAVLTSCYLEKIQIAGEP